MTQQEAWRQLWESLPGKTDALKRHRVVLSSADKIVSSRSWIQVFRKAADSP